MELEEFREYKSCPLCGSQNFKTFYHWPADYYPHDRFETCSWDGRQSIELTVVKCDDCQLIYTNPAFKKDYLHLVYPENLINIKDVEKSLFKRNKWGEIIDEMEKFLPSDAVVCDVGTRYGELVKILDERNYRAIGIEFNPASVAIARKYGVNVHEGTIYTMGSILKKLNFDRVNAFVLDDVLEHLTDPKQEIIEMARHQEKGDYLFLRQMDHDSLGRKIFGKKWYYYQPAAHMVYFNESTSGKMLAEAGYEIVKVNRTSLGKNMVHLFKIVLTRFLDDTGIGKWINRLTGKKTFKSRHQIYNGRLNYNSIRWHLSDIFLVIAQKK